MDKQSSLWLRLGEWLLRRRWWWIGLASLSVFFFEFMEYDPFQRGVVFSFFLEVGFYGIVLPVSTGLALSWLAGSRAELVWSTYYQDLKRNLDQQLHSVNSHNELAAVFLQFVRVVLPLAGVELHKYDPSAHSYKNILCWSVNRDVDLSTCSFACTAENCPCLAIQLAEKAMVLHPCPEGKNINAAGFCIPFLFSNNPVAAARLYFLPDSLPSTEHTRLLKEVAPEIASAFQRVQLQRIIQTRDESINTEQRRMARDVHDTLGHSLAYLRLRLDQISLELNNGHAKSLQQEVTALRDVAKEAYEQMRDMLITLSPNTDLNMNDTLEKYANRISNRANFNLSIHHTGKPQTLPAPVQRNVINIFREILTNIENHAHARQVDLDFHWHQNSFEVRVKDDGVGFDPTLPVEYGHFGLSNIRERALESNIQLFLSSQVGEGTQMILQIPYEAES